jgi:hypothetical protein
VFRSLTRWFGGFACLLALAAQLAVAASVPAEAEGAAPLGVICHADPDAGTAPAQPDHGPLHHGPDCLFCSLCATALPAPPALPVAVVMPSLAAAVIVAFPPVPEGTGPPTRFLRARPPRGPPQPA